MTRKEELQAEIDKINTQENDLLKSIEEAKMRIHFLKKRRKLVSEELDTVLITEPKPDSDGSAE